MRSLGNTWLLGLCRFAFDVLIGAAACALMLAAMDIIDVRYALLIASMLAGIGLLLEELTKLNGPPAEE